MFDRAFDPKGEALAKKFLIQAIKRDSKYVKEAFTELFSKVIDGLQLAFFFRV
jgi:hypothetical protein